MYFFLNLLGTQYCLPNHSFLELRLAVFLSLSLFLSLSFFFFRKCPVALFFLLKPLVCFFSTHQQKEISFSFVENIEAIRPSSDLCFKKIYFPMLFISIPNQPFIFVFVFKDISHIIHRRKVVTKDVFFLF